MDKVPKPVDTFIDYKGKKSISLPEELEDPSVTTLKLNGVEIELFKQTPTFNDLELISSVYKGHKVTKKLEGGESQGIKLMEQYLKDK